MVALVSSPLFWFGSISSSLICCKSFCSFDVNSCAQSCMHGLSSAVLCVQNCCKEDPQNLHMLSLVFANARIPNTLCKMRDPLQVSRFHYISRYYNWMIDRLPLKSCSLRCCDLSFVSDCWIYFILLLFLSLKIVCDRFVLKIQIAEAHWSVIKYQRISKQLFKY